MPKKSRRGKGKFKKRLKLRQSVTKEAGERLKPVAILSKPTVLPKVSAGRVEVGVRYQYVMVELKRIGIIAGAMFLLLIVLSFFLR